MVRVILSGLGAFAVLGYAVLPPPDKAPNAKTPTSKEPGALMAAGYDAVFNDLGILWKYGPGAVSRIPNNPLDAHPGLIYSGSNKVENELFKTRAKLIEDGWEIEEGVFTLISELWQNVKVDSADNSIVRTNKVAMWRSSNLSLGNQGLFRTSYRSSGKSDPKLLDFADQSVKLLAASPKGTFKKKIGDWQLYAESIFLRKKECLNCHRNMKLNEPIAIAAFAYKKP